MQSLWELRTWLAALLVKVMDMIIATRTLTLSTAQGDVAIPVAVHAPEREQDGAWFCASDVGWPDGSRTVRAGGADSVQALMHALQNIGAEIYTSSYHQAGRLRLEQPGSGYGFPVTPTLRDLLAGDDKKYL